MTSRNRLDESLARIAPIPELVVQRHLACPPFRSRWSIDMGIDLIRDDELKTVGITTWGWALKLARVYGWNPRGTIDDGYGRRGRIEIPSSDAPRTMDYCSNSYYLVDRDDATAVATAIEEALADISDLPLPVINPADPFEQRIEPRNAIEAFAGNHQDLRDLIAFLRRGEFRIA